MSPTWLIESPHVMTTMPRAFATEGDRRAQAITVPAKYRHQQAAIDKLLTTASLRSWPGDDHGRAWRTVSSSTSGAKPVVMTTS
jgi:hypothetical protein